MRLHFSHSFEKIGWCKTFHNTLSMCAVVADILLMLVINKASLDGSSSTDTLATHSRCISTSIQFKLIRPAYFCLLFLILGSCRVLTSEYHIVLSSKSWFPLKKLVKVYFGLWATLTTSRNHLREIHLNTRMVNWPLVSYPCANVILEVLQKKRVDQTQSIPFAVGKYHTRMVAFALDVNNHVHHMKPEDVWDNDL